MAAKYPSTSPSARQRESDVVKVGSAHGTLKANLAGVKATTEVHWDTSFTAGGRVGYWFARPVGLALDVSFFKPGSDRDSNLRPCDVSRAAHDQHRGSQRPSPTVSCRWTRPLHFTNDRPLHRNRVPEHFRDFDRGLADVGADVRGDLAYLITKSVALFVEYHFTHVKPEFTFTSPGTGQRWRQPWIPIT